MEIEEVVKRVNIFLDGEYRSDELYRVSVVLSQFGDIAKFIYHDPKYNPEARTFGVRKDEISIYGEAMCHLIALMISRGIDVSDALEAGMKRLEDKDGYKKKGEVVESKNTTTLKGARASHGIIEGMAIVIDPFSIEKLEAVLENSGDEGKILVTESLTPDSASHLREMNLIAIVTNEGGRTSHGAILAREKKIPCVSGTEKATEIIRTGDKVIVDGNKGEVVLRKRRG